MPYTPVPSVAAGDWIDEIFINTYWRDNMAASVPDVFSAKGQLAVATGVDAMGVLNVGIDGSVLVAEAAQTLGVKWDHLLNRLFPPLGITFNYQISRTVSSNNLTIAIKDVSGNDPSAASPIKVRIGNTLRSITAALSFTANAGSNYCNLGSSELAGKDTDVFIYLGWRASDASIFLALSRIPWATQYSHFSATQTSPKYAIFSGAAPASTDEVVNIGRINVALSASTAFQWSVPATSIVINQQIFITRWLAWAPTITGYSAVPGAASYQYQISGAGGVGRVELTIAEPLDGTSNATTHSYTLPYASSGGGWWRLPDARDNGTIVENAYVTAGTTTLNPSPSHSANWTASGASRMGSCQGWYIGV